MIKIVIGVIGLIVLRYFKVRLNNDLKNSYNIVKANAVDTEIDNKTEIIQ